MNKKSTGIISLKKTIILLVVAALLLTGYVWTRLKAVELSYRYSDLTRKELRLMDLNNKLRLEIASLKSPEKLTWLALQKLNFKKTPKNNKIFVKIEEPR